MNRTYLYAHLHGFASSHASRKGIYLAGVYQGRGQHLELPDLNRPSFAQLTYSGSLGAMDELDAHKGNPSQRWRISGSSMGGYLAARWAGLHPDRVDRLVLLCPGFNMKSRWSDLIGEDAMAAWEREGSRVLFDGTGKPVPVHFGFIEQGKKHPPWPEVPCPCLIIHGTRDEVVPIESSRSYAIAHPDRVELMEVEDDHSLMGSLEVIAKEIITFFEI